ncbi:hypothetical protein FKZ61_004395 [Litorilinea aerophila]|uniref:hypothetical protein n=1 Tax=Litorilinea aerophila TaxID=1204385 RepID=UPI001B8804AF|nr:hypothetical protein [Litorilinea aerophila]MCC9075349.1 hypothetical protein [Litorilinea aerophila]
MNRIVPRSMKKPRLMAVSVLVLAAVALAGCAGMPFDITQIPFVQQFLPPTPTFTPTPVPTPTPTPEPTPTPRPGETPLPPTPTPIPTPQVTIPEGFTILRDTERGYSLAVPRGWSQLDLRSQQFQNMANTFGMGGQIAQLNQFLDSPEGQAVGIVAVTDLTAVMFGGLPTVLNVSVIDAPGATPDSLLDFLQANLEANQSMLGDVDIQELNTAVVNNLPAVRGSVVADLSQYGMNARVFAKVVALIANDKVYILTLATQESNRGAKEPVFDAIIGTFRPE